MVPSPIDEVSLAQRVAQELSPGEVVGLGPGLPSLIPDYMPQGHGVIFVADSGVVGYRRLASGEAGNPPSFTDSSGQGVTLSSGGTVLNLVDLAAAVRNGNISTVVVECAQVSANGDFTHWTTASSLGLDAPASAVDWACGPQRMIAILRHAGPQGEPNVLAQPSLPLDGIGCISLIVTDVSVLRVTETGIVLTELAPGWRVEDVQALTGAPLAASPELREMALDAPHPGSASPGSVSKVFPDAQEAVKDVFDGAVVCLDGFAGPGGMAHYLMIALRDQGAKGLTMISNTAGIARIVNFGTPPGRQAIDHSILFENRQVSKVIASYPVSPSPAIPNAFELGFQRGEVELEVVPQGTLAERLRAGGAGVAAFYTPTGIGTLLAEGKETRLIDGREYVLEQALRADFCLIRGRAADTLGNVVYAGTSRNFNAVMAPAADVTVVEVDEIVAPGELAPEEIVTPGLFVDRVVLRPTGFSAYE